LLMAKSEDVKDRLLVGTTGEENPTTPFDMHCSDNNIAKDLIVMLLV